MATKRRPLPNWTIQVLDDVIMSASSAERQLDQLLRRLERGDSLSAGIAVARIAQEIATIRERATVARHAKREAS